MTPAFDNRESCVDHYASIYWIQSEIADINVYPPIDPRLIVLDKSEALAKAELVVGFIELNYPEVAQSLYPRKAGV